MNSRRIFHITHVVNLASIVKEGRLWSDAQRIGRGLATTNIGHAHIKQRRMRRTVPRGAGGVLGDYVPFNFCPRSVMLFAIHSGAVAGYDQGQEPIIHLASRVGAAVDLGRPWTFTNRHAELAYAEFFDQLECEGEVDWSLMPRKYWADAEETKEKRQAEFLVHESFPLDAIEEIGVMTPNIARQVESVFHGSEFSPTVTVQPLWYY